MAPPPPSKAATGANKEQPKNSERNEYIPSFIAKKPFYIDDSTATDDDYLQHQRLQSETKHSDPIATSQWYDRAQSRKKPAATKYRKGACENCGAMGHKAKDCLQRRRKAGAKWTGRAIAADEDGKDLSLGWDAKRDRWNGYDPSEYNKIVKDYEELERIKKQAAIEAGEEEEGVEDGDKYDAETDMGRNQATSTRNLRIREDTAKYLVNLDLDSAKYDPKTRSMIDTGDSTNELIADEGFQKAAGDATEFENAQRYAWETQERGDQEKLHLQANPTEGEMLRKRKAEDEAERSAAKKKMLLDAYGDQSTVQAKPKVLAASENFVEYDEKGRLKGQPERKEKSMYPEDILLNNHTSVWGSWWKDFQWGYACCHSIVKQSFCTGQAGIAAAEDSEYFGSGKALPANGEEEENISHVPNSVDAPEKMSRDERKRRDEELKAGVSSEEMERYRRQKQAANDPMAKINNDQLLEA
ncbi:60S ribosomal protein L37 [Polychaeton citri CBS 116435]|uniref:Pre-mRNA-splicing factor SLU7 n=1 Tax=Polychaeton citri CBS 116435 TaxID=1314669 RepID=A0A9P4QH85_9PEZI|nr:60S ribosomal protein L37 [Polychaeton citri CBS 116435]